MNTLTKARTLFSIEVFPPRDNSGLKDIYMSMGRFCALNPDYISVTYSAGGSGSQNTVGITSDIKNKFNIEPLQHLTCVNTSKAEAFSILETLRLNNINNILALRGDKRQNCEITDFNYATDLIKFINDFGGFNVVSACYPEGHIESKSLSFDLEVIRMKSQLGVKHFISQLFFDNDDFFRLQEKIASVAGDAKIEAGIMPITNPKQILRMLTLSGAKMPARLSKMLARFENNLDALRCAGLNYAIEQISDLLANGVDGIHLYAMNNPSIAETIYRAVEPMIKA